MQKVYTYIFTLMKKPEKNSLASNRFGLVREMNQRHQMAASNAALQLF